MSSHNSSVRSIKEEKSKNIQVVVRCRPFNTAERKSASHSVIDCDQPRREVNIRTGGISDKAARKTYTFDMVFGPSAKQIEVYRSVVCPILDEVILGYNCTVFAYGQTGTGKTFTMEGERSPNEEFTWEEDPLAGVIPRTLHQIFEKLSDNGTEFSVKVSLLEIYNEELFDLLSPTCDVTERLQMFDDPRNKRGVVIKGLEEITVHNKDEVYQILERGAAKRKTASTLMNAYSSRSHSVFSITIHMKEMTNDGEELVKIGKLNLVDLAGSENIGRSGAVDKRAREAGNINQSLLTLGRVITALVERTPHVPYRESKLTRILQDSLGGRTKTSIIATVSPASINLEETLSTLEYASRAKNIMNKPEVNQKLTKRALIKEYTEEIERLKRDLAAARDKNGVYLSNENFDTMKNKIETQEEQMTEFTEKISTLEEEMKRLMELFSDSRRELEQCSGDLQAVRQQLEAASADLQLTKQRLSEEAFLVSELSTTEQKLYGTAGKLLTVVEGSTQDVCGLHEKLDRKKTVEEHNADVQQSFSSRMEAMFSQMQKSVEEQGVKQQGMLSLYSRSAAGLREVNGHAFEEAISVITSSFKGIRDLVDVRVTKCQAEMAEQESACRTTNERLRQLLEEHKTELEDGLFALILPGLDAVMEMNENLKKTLRTQSDLAEKMESMKQDVASFFSDHKTALARMRESANTGFSSLQAEQETLKRQIVNANKKHETGMSQVISCLQNQLNLLSLETQSDFGELLAQSEAIQVPMCSLQQNIQKQCVAEEHSAASCQGRLEESADGLIAEIRHTAGEGQQMLEESSGQCGYLKTSLTQLAEKAALWCETTRGRTDAFVEVQLSKIKTGKDSAQDLKREVETSCDETVQDASGQLRRMQGSAVDALGVLEKQIGVDQTLLRQHTAELAASTSDGLASVHAFLKEELRQDVPTGRTPQRKEYVYPRVLAKTKSRHELLEHFKVQQQKLQEELTCEMVPEQVDQDSLEDEVSNCNGNDSAVTEYSYVEENIMCNEGSRAPFFKRKKGGKKENKNALDQSKMAENESTTPQRSKLPLRAQN